MSHIRYSLWIYIYRCVCVCVYYFFCCPMCVCVRRSHLHTHSIFCSCHLFVHSQFVNCVCAAFLHIASADLLTREKTGRAGPHTHIFLTRQFSFGLVFILFYVHTQPNPKMCACMKWLHRCICVLYIRKICSGGSGIHTCMHRKRGGRGHWEGGEWLGDWMSG